MHDENKKKHTLTMAEIEGEMDCSEAIPEVPGVVVFALRTPVVTAILTGLVTLGVPWVLMSSGFASINEVRAEMLQEAIATKGEDRVVGEAVERISTTIDELPEDREEGEGEGDDEDADEEGISRDE